MRAKTKEKRSNFVSYFFSCFSFAFCSSFRPDFVFVHFQIVQIQHEAGRRFGNVVMCFCHLLFAASARFFYIFHSTIYLIAPSTHLGFLFRNFSILKNKLKDLRKICYSKDNSNSYKGGYYENKISCCSGRRSGWVLCDLGAFGEKDIRLGRLSRSGERAKRLKKQGCKINDTVYHPEVWTPEEAQAWIF